MLSLKGWGSSLRPFIFFQYANIHKNVQTPYTPDMIVEIFTDGSCLRNPGGAGGWAAILRYGAAEKELSGYEPFTTNNRMELMAAIQGLEALKRPGQQVRLMSDSQYVIKGMISWVKGWAKKNWIRNDHKPVPNSDLWIRLIAASKDHRVQWVWVRGHNGHPENERCDELAGRAARSCR